MEEVSADNASAARLLGCRPVHSWQGAVRDQLAEMVVRQTRPMPLAMPSD